MAHTPTRAAMALVALLLAACSASAQHTTAPAADPPQAHPPHVNPPQANPPQPPLQPPNGEPYPGVYFDNPGVNPYVDTAEDPQSTFAMDVDTGSYTVARRFLTDGNVPDRDGIRVEEFVNYFDPHYAPPQTDAFAIHVDGGPTPFLRDEAYRLIRIGVQARDIGEVERDVALTFVIDVSGSMARENRLELVKRALGLLVDELRPTDTVAIVVYGSDARVVLPPTPLGEASRVRGAIEELRPEGSTNAEAGLRLAYDIAREGFRRGAINRVVLASDGVANVGLTNADSILRTIRDGTGTGIQLVTVGFGMGNYNDTLMEQLADNGDGFYAYVDTIDEAQRLFVDDLAGTLTTVALDAKVQVSFDPSRVDRYRLVGYENRDVADDDFRDDSVDAGAIGAGHHVTALYEVRLIDGVRGSLGDVRLRWTDPDTREPVESKAPISTQQLVDRFSDGDPYFQLAAVVAEWAEVLRQSPWAEGQSLASVAEAADALPPSLFEDRDAADFVSLTRMAARLVPFD